MKKGFLYYLLVWLIGVAAFNIVFFVMSKKVTDDYYWPGYIACILVFLGHLVCGFIASRAESLKSAVYRIPAVRISFIGLILTTVLGVYFAVDRFIPSWVRICVIVAVLAVTLILVVLSAGSADVLDLKDRRVSGTTMFAREMGRRTELLAKQCADPEIRKEVLKAADILKYSDPMSIKATANLERSIEDAVTELNTLTESGDLAGVRETVGKIVKAAEKRNSIIKTSK